jgi:molybdenum cofactor cytidylyltransferase
VITGIVLAAGTSSRLGAPKQLMEVGGRPLLQHAIDAIAGSSVNEVVVVVGHMADRIRGAVPLPPKARFVMNPRYVDGQVTSLQAGLRAADPGSQAAVVVMGDQPRMSTELIELVIERWRRSRPPALRPIFNGAPGHPVVLSRPVWSAFDGATGDDGARRVIGALIGAVDYEVGTNALADIDTPEDLARAQNSISGPPKN